MRRATACLALAAGASEAARLTKNDVSPVSKVLTLLDRLELKVIEDGKTEQIAYTEYVQWCQGGAKDKNYEIVTAKSSIEDLTATIGQADSDIETSSSKVEDLAAAINTNNVDLKAAANIRKKENDEFTATQKELVDAVDTLERAINILQRKMAGSAMLQQKVNKKDVRSMIHALNVIVDAAALSLHDKNKLLGLVQNSEDADDEEDDEMLGAPDPEAYKSHGSSIVDVLEDLKQKAVSELDEARKEEMNSKHAFEMTHQSLDDQIAADTKEMNAAKTTKHEGTETKANAEGEITVTKKDLADAESVLKNMKGDCMARSADHETSVKNRDEELKAIGAAKKIINEMTAGAADQSYKGAAVFLQLQKEIAEGGGAEEHDQVHEQQLAAKLVTRVDLAGFEVVNLVRKLAREQKSAAMAQLAGRISAAMREGQGAGDDPFVKVKNLISEMINRLIKETGEEAQHKAYCDKEMAETSKKTGELKYDIEKLSSKIDKAKSDSAMLKEEVGELQKEIAEIDKSQGTSDECRRDEKKTYAEAVADLKQGLDGIRQALKILRDYYATDTSLLQQPAPPQNQEKSSGAGGGILGMLEVIEADFGKSLATTEMIEETAATAYQRMSAENRVSKSMKEKDVEYKTKTAVSNDKMAMELSSDLSSNQNELDAVLQYTTNIRGMCELKPESYDDRKGRREAELQGLKEALQILEGEAVFLQHMVAKSNHAALLQRRKGHLHAGGLRGARK